MTTKIFHGDINPTDFAQALIAEFNSGNLAVQQIGSRDEIVLQIATRQMRRSGGKTAISIAIKKVADGVSIDVGKQSWFGVAASLGTTALAALRNPFSLLGRLDDVAQDIESLQLIEDIWDTIDQVSRSANATFELSERLKRIVCEYCNTANPVGASNCIACGAPLGNVQPRTCPQCGFVLKADDTRCPNCGYTL
ncbi:MAG: zinc ribbon domain-containing protein [Anaerolineales bacterium]|nr:zinc ribbon domain-containing protein [Anaerolineales bacterium]